MRPLGKRQDQHLGPDIYPEDPEAAGDMFGAVVVATRNGKMLAIGAQTNKDIASLLNTNLKPYVEILYHLVDDGDITQKWERVGERIINWTTPQKEYVPRQCQV